MDKNQHRKERNRQGSHSVFNGERQAEDDNPRNCRVVEQTWTAGLIVSSDNEPC